MKKFEYKELYNDLGEMLYSNPETIRLLGLDGWELVSVISDEKGVPTIYYFKREIEV